MKFKKQVERSFSKKQVSGGFLSVEWVKNPELARPHLERAANAGYAYWFCVVRHMKLNLLDDCVKTALKRIIDIAHEYKLKFMLDTDPTHWAEDVVTRDPLAALWVIIPVSVDVYNGRFEVFVQEPQSSRQSTIVEVSAVYGLGGKIGFTNLKSKFRFEWQHVGRPVNGYQLRGRLPDNYQGRIKLYVTASNNSRIDHASKTYFSMQSELLENYRDLPLDGIAWDEPGKGHGDMTSFRAGHDFFKLFKTTNGYELRDKLIYLDEFDDTPEAAKIRCDYYRTLSDMNYHVQKVHFEQAKSIWGEHIILGTHPTWSGLPCDLAAGVFDHFRLSHVLTDAWTDGGYALERKALLFPIMLADSIKKGLKRRNAYYNDWIYQPNHSYYRLMNRLKTLYHVNTFTHVYSDFTEGITALQLEPIKSLVDNDAALLNKLDEMIGERTGESQFAVWYGWEGYASMQKQFARAEYTFFQNISLLLTDSSLFADFVSSELLMDGKMLDGKLHTSGGKYSVLVLPYARVLPVGLWKKLLQYNRHGLKLVFVGPEPAFEADGKNINFASVAGFKSFGPASYLQESAAKRFKIAPDAWEPPFLDVVPEPDIINPKSERIENFFHELVALHNRSGIYWLPGLDPREDLIGVLKKWDESQVKVYGNCIYRLFGETRDGVLILAPRDGAPGWGVTPSSQEIPGTLQHESKIWPFDGIIKYAGRVFEFSGCEWASIHFKNGKIINSMSEGREFKIKEC
ncbi:MAG: hypothetical protein WCI51_09035 [Lentisphaerota bacterium]